MGHEQKPAKTFDSYLGHQKRLDLTSASMLQLLPRVRLGAIQNHCKHLLRINSELQDRTVLPVSLQYCLFSLFLQWDINNKRSNVTNIEKRNKKNPLHDKRNDEIRRSECRWRESTVYNTNDNGSHDNANDLK